ncbi:ARM repeat-containing protein, partial [Sistotremastrum niveocremeum HHB9708]
MVVAANSGKKRANSSSASSFKKRPRIDGPKKEEKSKSKGALRAEKENISTSKVKRSKPVTVDVVDDRSEEDSEGEDFEAEENGDEGMDVDPGEDDVVLYEGTQPKSSARESHAAQRAIANERKASKPHASLLVEAKRLWSSVRQKNDISKAERQKAVRALMDCVRGKVQEIVFKHDASRIIQSIVKYGGQKERDEIALELKGKYVELCQNKYSKFLVTKLVRYSPSNRSSILSEFHGHVLRLLLHREASSTVADCYELYANAADRTALVWDLYGKEVALFATQTKKSLKDLLAEVDEARRKRVLEAVKDNILNIVNNPDKGAVTHAIFHRVILEYLTEIKYLSDEEEEKLRREIFDSCYELLAEMVHTRDGSRVVREFIAQGSAKDRKAILKTLKPHVEKMCSVDEAQVVLFTALDVIDDTKLLSKSLIQPMTSTCPQLLLPSSASSAATRRSILYLLVPRSNRHFTPAIVNTIAETDSIREKTSKKDNELRRDEIRKFASPDLLQFVVEHAKELISDPGGSLVVGEIMLYSDG